MRDKIAENVEVFLQRPLAPRKPGSELPPEVKHAHEAPTKMWWLHRILGVQLLNAGNCSSLHFPAFKQFPAFSLMLE